MSRLEASSLENCPRHILNGKVSIRTCVSILVVVLVFAWALAASSPLAGGTVAMSLDGSAKNGCGYVGACSVSLTTTQPSDVIIVGCDCLPYGVSFTVIDTAGLTFHPRMAQLGIGGNQFIQTWYTVAPTAVTSDTVSVQTSSTGETWYGVIAFAVSGANTASPFDSNPSLSRAQANIACPGGDPCNTGVSTSGPDFVFQFGGNTGGAVETSGTGFTLIQDGTSGQDAYAQYEVTSDGLSSTTLLFGSSLRNDFGVVTDALVPATVSTSSTSVTSTTTSVSPPSTDGSAKIGCGYVTACTLSLSTSHSSDVIIVGCDCLPAGAAFSVRDTADLNFLPRTAQLSIGGNQFIQTWYAIATVPLSGDRISVVTLTTGETWYGVVAFGVSGANIRYPFDPNPDLPVRQANVACPGENPCNTGVSTTDGDDFVFQFGGNTGGAVETSGTGFTLIQDGTSGQDAYAQYRIASTPLHSTTLAFGTSQGHDFGVIADAIQPGPSTSTTSTGSSSSSSTSASSTTSSSTTASTPPFIDGSYWNATVNCGVAGHTSCSAVLTTMFSPDLVVVFGQTESLQFASCSGLAAPSLSGVTDSSGLTWHLRTTVTSASTPSSDGWCYQFHLEEWYARPNSTLSGDKIQVHVAAGLTPTQHLGLLAFGVANINQLHPYDTNPNADCTGTGTSTTFSCEVSTSSPDDLIIGGPDFFFGAFSFGTGFQTISPYFAPDCTTQVDVSCSEYQTAGSAETGFSVFYTQATNAIWCLIGDSIQASGVSSSMTSSSSTSGHVSSIGTGGSASPRIGVAMGVAYIRSNIATTGNIQMINLASASNQRWPFQILMSLPTSREFGTVTSHILEFRASSAN